MIFAVSYRAVERVGRWSAYASAVVLVGAMLVTIADIVLRAVARGAGLFTGQALELAVPGVVDLVQLFVMATAYLAIPFAFTVDGHVSVELVTERLPTRAEFLAKGVAAVLATGFMAAILLYCFEQAVLQQSYGDQSHTIGIPILWYWVPLLAGAALSVVATVMVAARFLWRAAAGHDPAASPR